MGSFYLVEKPRGEWTFFRITMEHSFKRMNAFWQIMTADITFLQQASKGRNKIARTIHASPSNGGQWRNTSRFVMKGAKFSSSFPL